MERATQNEAPEKKINVDIPPETDLNDYDKNNEHSPNLTLVLESEQLLRKLVASEIKFAQPVLEQSGNAVIFPHTINVIQGQAGKHKSRLVVVLPLLLRMGRRNRPPIRTARPPRQCTCNSAINTTATYRHSRHNGLL